MALDNIAPSFVWGANGSKLTPEQIATLQAIEAKRSGAIDVSPVQSWTQGAARVADAIAGAFRRGSLDKAEKDNTSYNSSLISNLIGGGAPATSAVPMSGSGAEVSATNPAPSNWDPNNLDPSIKTGIASTANALGISPVDLATAISYETGGTFDPTKGGPTTQWGQHRGLIQFGEPQAKEYGVDWDDPINSQLGENGAVAKYLRATGVQPGMGMMDIYSAINAGGVGRYNASDANNGGAPGTVADKVNNQMAAHRAKALAMFGDTASAAPQTATDAIAAYAPQQAAPTLPPSTTIDAAPPVASVPSQQVAQAVPAPSANPAMNPAILKVLTDPRATPQTQAVAQALLQQQAQQARQVAEQQQWLQRQQYEAEQKARDPLNRINVQKGEIELRNLQTPPEPDGVRALRARAAAAGLREGTPEFSNFMITQGVKPPANVGTPPAGYQIKYDDAGNPVSMAPIPGGPADTSRKDQAAAESRDTSTGVITTAAQRARDAMSADGLPANGIMGAIASVSPNTNAAELRRQVGVLTSNATIENLNAMRQQSPTGGALGNVTEGEGKMLAAKAGTLDPNSPNFARDLDDYERTLLKIVHGGQRGEEIFNATRKAPVSKQQETQDRVPEGVDPSIWQYMTPEEKKLWQN